MYFPLNSSNDVLIVFPYNFSKLILILKQFLTRMQKILSGRMVRDGEKPHVSFKAYNRIKNILYVSIHSYLNRHNYFKWYIEKGAMSITSRRIDKCPTPKQRLSDKFPTARTYKMTNSWQMPRRDGHTNWNWLSHYYYHLNHLFLSFHWPRAHHVTCK